MTLSMTCGQFEDILPQLLDDVTVAVPPAARLHLERCATCRELYDDLTGLRTTAAALPPITPSRDLWAGIEARIRTPVVPLLEGVEVRRPQRQISLRSATIAAAALALVNASVSYTFMNRTQPATSTVASAPAVPAPVAMRTAVGQEMMTLPLRAVSIAPSRPSRPTMVLAANGPEIDQGSDELMQQPRRREAAKAVYDREIHRLRAIVDSGRHRLDPATAALLDRNMRIIDTAIEQVNQALVRDSSSTFLIQSLNNAYQTKVKLLRIAAAAASRG